MKLTIKHIQALDVMLKKLDNLNNFTKEGNELNIVIRFDNQLWRGNFVLYKDLNFYKEYIDFDNYIEHKAYSQMKLFSLPHEFKFKRFANIQPYNSYLLFNELLDVVKNLDLSNLDFYPVLYNATNITNDFKLTFMQLDPNIEYEVVSIVESPKDECTHF